MPQPLQKKRGGLPEQVKKSAVVEFPCFFISSGKLSPHRVPPVGFPLSFDRTRMGTFQMRAMAELSVPIKAPAPILVVAGTVTLIPKRLKQPLVLKQPHFSKRFGVHVGSTFRSRQRMNVPNGETIVFPGDRMVVGIGEKQNHLTMINPTHTFEQGDFIRGVANGRL